MFEEYAKETWSGSERNGYFAPSEMSTTNGYRFLNRFTGSETELPNIVHGSSSSCAIMLWFFIQLSTTLRILSTWAHRVKCHVRCLLAYSSSKTHGSRTWVLPKTIHVSRRAALLSNYTSWFPFLISCCWCKPSPNLILCLSEGFRIGRSPHCTGADQSGRCLPKQPPMQCWGTDECPTSISIIPNYQ